MMMMFQKDPVAREIFDVLDGCLPEAKGHTLVLGLSGGRDSSVLLHLLRDYATAKGDVRLIAVHVHHGIRGEEADRDAQFCADLCRELNVPLTTVCRNVPAYAKEHRMGLEEAARLLRYEALREIASGQNQPACIVTAHHAADQLETVLMHLIRGSGIEGLCGMEERSTDLLRPMLRVRAEAIDGFARQHHIPYVTDSTNADNRYTRNQLRNEIIPLLKGLNPALEEAVGRLTESLRGDDDHLEEHALRYSFADGTHLLAALPDALLSRVIKREHRQLLPGGPMLTHQAITEAMHAVRCAKPHTSVSLPGATLIVDRNRLLLRSLEEEERRPDPMLLHEGWQTYDGGRSMILLRRGKLTEQDLEQIDKADCSYRFRRLVRLKATMSDRIWMVRYRREGDTYYDGRHTRNIRKLLQAQKLPLCVRKYYPLICEGDRVIFLPDFRVDPALTEQDPQADALTILCFFDRRANT